MKSQMIRVISSPSSSTTGLATLILAMRCPFGIWRSERTRPSLDRRPRRGKSGSRPQAEPTSPEGRRRKRSRPPMPRIRQPGSEAGAVCGKSVLTPDGAPSARRPRVDNAMVKALARAFRWRKMLDTGVHATLDDLARAKAVAPSYVSRILRLTLLAPEIVEAILDGRQPVELQLDDLLNGFPLEWQEQSLDRSKGRRSPPAAGRAGARSRPRACGAAVRRVAWGREGHRQDPAGHGSRMACIFPGSPSARMARVLIREWGLRVERSNTSFRRRRSFSRSIRSGRCQCFSSTGRRPSQPCWCWSGFGSWQAARTPPMAHGATARCSSRSCRRATRWFPRATSAGRGSGRSGPTTSATTRPNAISPGVGATLAWLGLRRERQVQGRAPELRTPPQGVRVAVGQGHRSDDQEPYLIRHFLRRPSGVTRIGR